MDVTPILTIGYGNRTMDDFLALLRREQVETLVDVRSAPYSRFNKEFSREGLAARVKRAGLHYLFLGWELGGKPDDPELYEDGALVYERARAKASFQEALGRLARASEAAHRVCLLCAELRPESCHRTRLIAPALIDAGLDVEHLDEAGVRVSHATVVARIDGGQLPLF